MKKIYLCGHTGSINRGCEAIVRSTTEILKKCGVKDISAFTFNINDDISLGVDKELSLISYPKKPLLLKACSFVENIIFKNKKWSNRPLYYKLLKENKLNFITLNIGGDTYCYGTPNISYSLNDIAFKRGFPNIFWGCSIDDTALKDPIMQRDINKYKYIIVRETLSQKILNKIVNDSTKIHLACDPAFNLSINETELPIGFIENNTVGINLSPLVFKDCENLNDIMYKNVVDLINYIIDNTGMNICLIPHVYNVQKNEQDYFVLSKIYDKYKETKRVSIVDRELSCTQLKYIISKCRFFIGARTHATIAAYSTGVPAIALSYSIKSRGIAKDLFGIEKGYVIRWQDIKEENVLKDAFINTLLNNEKNIRERYDRILPEYKNSILEVTKEVLNKIGG